MARTFLITLFVMTGIFPLCLGMFLAYKEDYFVSVGCLLIAVFGFQQVYKNSTVEDLIVSLKKTVSEQEKELVNQKKLITQNLADVFASKVEYQEKLIARQRQELAQASKFLEHKNKEIRLLREDYDD